MSRCFFALGLLLSSFGNVSAWVWRKDDTLYINPLPFKWTNQSTTNWNDVNWSKEPPQYWLYPPGGDLIKLSTIALIRHFSNSMRRNFFNGALLQTWPGPPGTPPPSDTLMANVITAASPLELTNETVVQMQLPHLEPLDPKWFPSVVSAEYGIYLAQGATKGYVFADRVVVAANTKKMDVAILRLTITARKLFDLGYVFLRKPLPTATRAQVRSYAWVWPQRPLVESQQTLKRDGFFLGPTTSADTSLNAYYHSISSGPMFVGAAVAKVGTLELVCVDSGREGPGKVVNNLLRAWNICSRWEILMNCFNATGHYNHQPSCFYT